MSYSYKTTTFRYGPSHQVRKGDKISYNFSSSIQVQIKYGIPAQFLDFFLKNALTENYGVTYTAPANGKYRVAVKVKWRIEKGTLAIISNATGKVISRRSYEIWQPISTYTELERTR